MDLGDVALPVLETAIGAAGSILGGSQRQADAEQQASTLDSNAGELDRQSLEAIAKGQWQKGRISTRTGQNLGGVAAGTAASGLSISGGTVTDLYDQTQHLGVLDQLMEQRNAAAIARGLSMEGQNLRRKANSIRSAGQVDANMGDMNAVTGIVTGGMKALGNYNTWNSTQAPTQIPGLG